MVHQAQDTPCQDRALVAQDSAGKGEHFCRKCGAMEYVLPAGGAAAAAILPRYSLSRVPVMSGGPASARRRSSATTNPTAALREPKISQRAARNRRWHRACAFGSAGLSTALSAARRSNRPPLFEGGFGALEKGLQVPEKGSKFCAWSHSSFFRVDPNFLLVRPQYAAPPPLRVALLLRRGCGTSPRLADVDWIDAGPRILAFWRAAAAPCPWTWPGGPRDAMFASGEAGGARRGGGQQSRALNGRILAYVRGWMLWACLRGAWVEAATRAGARVPSLRTPSWPAGRREAPGGAEGGGAGRIVSACLREFADGCAGLFHNPDERGRAATGRAGAKGLRADTGTVCRV